jgi:hypothetical protein
MVPSVIYSLGGGEGPGNWLQAQFSGRHLGQGDPSLMGQTSHAPWEMRLWQPVQDSIEGPAGDGVLRLNDAFANGVLHQFGAGMQIELAHDVFAMAGDSLGADGQGFGYLTGAGPIGQMGQHLLLACGQSVKRPLAFGFMLLGQVVFDQKLGQGWI